MQFPYKKIFTTAAILSMFFSSQTLYAGLKKNAAAYDKKNHAQAIEVFKPLAEKGDAKAQFQLGLMYDRGQSVPQDYAQAVIWYRKAAEQGFSDAQINLGVMYDIGLGVAQDDAQALNWYRKAAEQGNPTAQVNLGRKYKNGHGVAQDDAQAVIWFRKAAEKGSADAQGYLGTMYYFGRGVPMSKIAAYALLHIPSNQNSEATNKSGTLVEMSTADLAQAKALSFEMAKPNNLLKALDQYISKAVKRQQ